MSRSEQRAKLLALATQVWMAFGVALAKLPQNTQATLKRAVVDSDVRWVLSLVLAAAIGINRGQQRESAAMAQARGLSSETFRMLMADMGAGFVVAQAEPWLQRMPDLSSALAAGQTEQAAAALAQMINASPDHQRELTAWLEGDEFLSVGWAVVRRFPAPGYGRPSLWSERPDDPLPAAKAARGERFDRADFGARHTKKK
jgi:hypothetical protein